MTAAYREQALRCPGCAAWLEPSPVESVEGADQATIDACPGCGAIWVDWFDGDLPAMAREARKAPARPAAGGGRGELGCPRCQVPLTEERYPGSAADVLRCGDCGGAFVPQAALRALSLATPREDGAPEPTGLGRLLALLRGWLG